MTAGLYLFQFHSGSIQTIRGELANTAALEFQFHSGSIQTPGDHQAAWRPTQFQFHSGSIQTWLLKSAYADMKEVSIPLWFDSNLKSLGNLIEVINRFNSTLVRFKLARSASSVMSHPMFQFHSGSIQTYFRI